MKRVLLLLLVVPSFVFASSLDCENGNYKLNDEFKCVLKSSIDNMNQLWVQSKFLNI